MRENDVLLSFFNCAESDPLIDSKHIAIFLVLYSKWIMNGCQERFRIYRAEIMSLAKISSTATYFMKIRDLGKLKYIRYYPDNCSLRGTYVGMNNKN